MTDDAQVPPARGGAPTLPQEPASASHAPAGSPRRFRDTLSAQRLQGAHLRATTLRPSTRTAMPARGAAAERLDFACDPQLIAVLETLAELAGVSRAEMARRMMVRGIEATATERKRQLVRIHRGEKAMGDPLDALPIAGAER